MKRAGLGISALLATGMAIFAGCTGDDPVFSDTAPDAGPPLPSDDGGPAADGGQDASPPDAGADAPVARISIAGKLVKNYNTIPEDGLFVPLSGPAVSVYIAGKKVPLIGAGGTFAMDDVATPYDAFVVETNASLGTRVWGYLGLTRPDPILFGGLEGATIYEAYAMGTLSPAPSNGQIAQIAVGGDGTDGFPDATNTATYSQGHVRWSSNPAPLVRAAAYVMTLDSTTFLPTFFSAYGSTAAYTPVSGAAPDTKDIFLTTVFTMQAHVNVSVPPTSAIRQRLITYHPSGGPDFRIDTTDPSPTSLDFGVPSNASAEMEITAQPTSAGGADDLVQSILRPIAMGSQTLTVPPITTRLTAPTLGTISAGTPIAWSKTPNAVYRFLMYSAPATSSGFGPDSLVFYLNTTATAATMPDLTKLGLTLPSGMYLAEIGALAPFSSLDAICGPDGTTAFQSHTNAAGIKLAAP